MIDLANFEAVIFDMDGVLIDSEPLWKIAMEQTFREVGSHLTKQDFQQTVGLRLDEVINYWYAHQAWQGVSPQVVEKRIVARMVTLIQENGSPLPGVIETLAFLKTQSVKIGLATSSYSVLIDTVLSTLNITDAFDYTHSAEHESFGKPHPAVYLTVAAQLDVSPLKCLVIEDSLNGIISGKAARMQVVCIPEKTHLVDSRLQLADFRYEDMLLLLEDLK